MKKILFLKNKSCNARWIDNDLKILNSQYKVTLMDVNLTKGFALLFSLLYQFIKILFTIHKYNLIYIWFADYHSILPVFFARVFRVKCVVVIGGYDADEILINTPVSIKQKIRKYCVLYTIRKCSILLPVSEIIKQYLSRFVNSEKCIVLYNCVNENLFYTNIIPDKESLIITVGGGGDYIKEAKRKRIDLFLNIGNEFTNKFPEYNARFIAIGHNKNSQTYNFLKKIPNTGKVSIESLVEDLDSLIKIYQKASIYMQLSFYESFGIAQAEAMLFGCIPVSNNGGAIPEIVGDAGFLVENYDVEKYLTIIKEILDKKHESLRIKAKNRILNKFSYDNRMNRLLEIIK